MLTTTVRLTRRQIAALEEKLRAEGLDDAGIKILPDIQITDTGTNVICSLSEMEDTPKEYQQRVLQRVHELYESVRTLGQGPTITLSCADWKPKLEERLLQDLWEAKWKKEETKRKEEFRREMFRFTEDGIEINPDLGLTLHHEVAQVTLEEFKKRAEDRLARMFMEEVKDDES